MLAQAMPIPLTTSHAAGSLDEFVNGIGDVAQCHALVIGEHTLELVCLLIRRGCIAAGTLRWHEKAQAGAADLVVVSPLPQLPMLDEALRQARRALLPGGRIVLRVTGRRTKTAVAAVAGMLSRYGFGAARLTATAGGVTVQAELPRSGALRHG